MIQTGSDFSGVGAFTQALKRLKINYKTVFSCEMDLYARETYMANHGEPTYYPFDVYEREIPKQFLDIYMTSPPCQAFSLAGNRKGENDKRGVLFYNSHKFITKNKPRYFIFENVKGLLSDNAGKTFQVWLDMLGGKTINGNPVIFPRENATPYHIYYKVLNAKNYGVPQNRERVFIIGIRDDSDNNFHWPKSFPLKKRLKDVLESDVDEKFYLSDLAIERLCYNDSGFSSEPKDDNDIASTVCASDYKIARGMNVLKVKSATKKGFEVATENDSINLSNLSSETRRGRVDKEVAQTLDTTCKQAVMIMHISRTELGKKIRKKATQKGKDYTPFNAKKISFKKSAVMNCITTATTKDNLVKIAAIRGRGNTNTQKLEINTTGNSNSLTTVQKDNVVLEKWVQGGTQKNQAQKTNGVSPCLTSAMGMGGGQTPIHNYDYKIRKLTPRECFRLMDFPDSFIINKVSNTQAYKQAGNSIVVNVLVEILKKLNIN